MDYCEYRGWRVIPLMGGGGQRVGVGAAELIRAIYTQLVMVASNIILYTHNTQLNTVCYC